MATVGLYGSSSSGVVAAATGSESTGLYGNNVNFGGSYFEWFIFQQSDTQPATPTGGSWDFTTNTGTPPTGWSSTPSSAPTNKVWVSIALVNSKNSSTLTWSAPGLFSYSSGLPVLSGNGSPGSGDGQSDQLYIQLDTTPQTIWFKESGTWTRLTGSSLYVDLTSNQTIAGTKTFSSQIQGSISGTASNVTGVVGISNGGTGATTASGARTSLGAAASGANSDITSMSGITGAISTPDNIQFDTTATATVALGNLRWNTTTKTMSFGIIDGTDEVSIGEQMFAYVTNAESITITRGQPVYLYQATGNRASVKLAANTSDATSAKTLGLASQDIAAGASGFVITQGTLDKIDTSAFSEGTTLYLGATAGTLTSTKPKAPNHLVYIGVVERANAGNGQIYVRPQNGYELDEIHDVQINSPVSGNTLIYDATTSLWKNALLTAGSGITITNGAGSITISAPETGTVTSVNVSGGTTGLTTSGGPITSSGTITLAGTLAISNGGTGQTTATAAFNALAPSQTGNAGKYLTTDGTNASWATNPLGTVTSVDASGGTTGLTFSGGPITTSGTLTLAGTLAVANGGTGVTTSTGTGSVVLSTSPTLVTPALGTPVSGNFSTGTFTWPTFNQNTTGNAATATTATNVSGGTASVTTLTTSSTVTINGGTANGVAYLNGSKVLTTGSALTFNGTDFSLLSGGAATIYDSTANNRIILGADSSGAYIKSTFSSGGTTDLRFINASTEGMRLTSTGLGIGTSSPAFKLDVAGNMSLSNGSQYCFGSNNYNGMTGSSATNTIQFYTNNAARLTVDSSGNLGLGVTPSAWNSAYKAFQLNTQPAVWGSADALFISVNQFQNTSGSNRYIANGFATQYRQDTGQHQWYTAPSGTAGNAITFTQAMTLAAGALTLQRPSSGANTDFIFNNEIANARARIRFGGTNEELAFFQPVGGNETEVARFASASLYLNCTTSPTVNVTGVGGIGMLVTSGDAFNLKHTVNGNTIMNMWQTGTSAASAISFCKGNSQVQVGSISITTTATTYNTSSDYRLKENIQPMTGALAKVAALKPCTYKWKADGSDGEGFIAHELQVVVPQCVTGEKDAVDEDGKPVYQGIDTSFLVATLTAAIQEQQAVIEQLKADVAALKQGA